MHNAKSKCKYQYHQGHSQGGHAPQSSMEWIFLKKNNWRRWEIEPALFSKVTLQKCSVAPLELKF